MITPFDIAVFTIAGIVCVLLYFKWKFSYWANKQVPFIEPHFPFGTIENPLKKTCNNAIWLQKQYHHLKSLGHKYGGVYTSIQPGLLLADPETIQNVMQKDFQYFTDRGVFHNEKKDPLSANLFTLEGQKWRNLRAKLTPTFTTGKIKAMFPTLVACGDPLYERVTELNQKNLPVDVKDLLARYTTDVIGSCAFGLDCNSFQEPESDIRKFGRLQFIPFSKFQVFKLLIIAVSPELAKRIGLTISDLRNKQFFLNVVKETVNYRKKNNVFRNDFMQLLLNLIDEEEHGNGLTIKEVAAQAYVFFLAGFETSSTTMTFCLYELATNQEIQRRVRDEIVTVLKRHNGNITYDAIMEMHYLNSVIDETLRKYPPLPIIPRICVQNYQIPHTKVVIEAGTRLSIPVYALHHDPDHFPNPHKFDPDRFSDRNKSDIRAFTYIPFGEGPRICIGLRFGLLQTKVGLAMLLKTFNFELNAKTKVPLEFNNSSFILTAKDGIWLNVQKVEHTDS